MNSIAYWFSFLTRHVSLPCLVILSASFSASADEAECLQRCIGVMSFHFGLSDFENKYLVLQHGMGKATALSVVDQEYLEHPGRLFLQKRQQSDALDPFSYVEPDWKRPEARECDEYNVRAKIVYSLRLRLYFDPETDRLIWKDVVIERRSGSTYGFSNCIKSSLKWSFLRASGRIKADREQRMLAKRIIDYFALSDFREIFETNGNKQLVAQLETWALSDSQINYAEIVYPILRRAIERTLPDDASDVGSLAECVFQATGHDDLILWSLRPPKERSRVRSTLLNRLTLPQ
jgi:hypothetical protein